MAAAWSPPEKTDPRAILLEARDDRAHRRYDEALAKHLWFHNEALKVDPAYSGVRLSFALADWAILASRYEPAMVALRAARDAAAENVRARRQARSAFADFAAINAELDDEALTRRAFAEIEASDPALARAVFRSAEDALIEAKDYATCGRYLDAKAELQHLAEVQAHFAARARDPATSPMEKKAEESFYANQASRIVALLVLNNRRAEAIEAARSARRVLDTPAVNAALERAREGKLPGAMVSKADKKKLRAMMP